ncbi:hypothetical protein [Cellulomonas denverensis]|uniref:Uncharacterized protein n=1 Tax=Cellulomonas denverensis TaxID=264297 RepID=A0A7X6QZ36_9CELL|nr:hypothetical protein [Cellulomonas denverensis]NKY22765.1 hypothetical protein [Cellulomonas denverensis]
MAVVDYFLTGPHEAGKALMRDALSREGFSVEAELPNGGWTVGRGSKAKTFWLGAFAGKDAQRLTFTVRFFEHQGNLVARLERESGSGMMAGAVGVARSNDIFEQTVGAIGQTLHAAGVLAGSARG